MAYSYNVYTGNGSQTQFPVAFGYIRREHVLATVAGSPATFTWVNSSTIQMDTAPANGATVRVYRVTPLSAPLVDFTDGATLIAADLDTNAKQSIYTQQELDDSLADGLAGVIPNGDKGDITTSVGGTVWTIDSGAITEAKVATGAITEAKVANGAVTTEKLASVIAPTVSSLNGGPIAGNRNRIINGAMAVDQRNAGAAQTFTAAAALAYNVDRWYGYCTGANVTGQRITGATAGQFYYRFTGAASVTAIGFGHRIEQLNSANFASSTATLSVDLANSLLTTVTWTAYYATTADTFGTLASPTRTQIATGTFTVTSTVTRYNTNISVPAAATTGIEIVFTVGAQTSGTWTVGNVQLEPGTVATPFERRIYGQELALCQRYYQAISRIDWNPNAYAGGTPYFQLFYKVSMRTAATFTLGTPGSGSGAWTADLPTVDGCRVYAANTSTIAFYGNNTISSEL